MLLWQLSMTLRARTRACVRERLTAMSVAQLLTVRNGLRQQHGLFESLVQLPWKQVGG